MAALVVIDKTFSDGNPAMRPPPGGNILPDDSSQYMKKLAHMWMQEMGKLVPGKTYTLDALPAGYAVFYRRRPNTTHVDRYLYGHPSGSIYRSVPEFWPHFLYLMKHDGSPCACALCVKKTSARTGSAPPTRKPSARKIHEKSVAFDYENTPDIWKALVMKLKRTDIDQDVSEKASPDWRAGREHLELYLHRAVAQQSYLPRIGELVLWAPDIKGEIRYNAATSTFQVFSRSNDAFVSDVPWRAGIVAQVPEHTVFLPEAFKETDNTKAINMSGFRVETLADPNSRDKSAPLQYRYVPLAHIRPMNFWQVFLMKIDPMTFHPSIDAALTILSSLSVLGKHHFRGSWPNATLSCKGLYLGAELLLAGDTVCLASQDAINPACMRPPPVTDVLVVADIEVRLEKCDDRPESDLLCEKTSIRLVGETYTRDLGRAHRSADSTAGPNPLTDDEVLSAFRAVGLREYGPWYRRQAKGTMTRVSPDLVLGRAYELDYIRHMFNGTSLSYNLSGILAGREYGRKTDARIPEDKQWFFGDTRAESLSLATVNGIEVGKYDTARDMEMLQASLRVIDGVATQQDVKGAKVLGRPTAYGMIGSTTHKMGTFESVGKTSTMVAAALEPSATSTNNGESELAEAESVTEPEAPQRSPSSPVAVPSEDVEMSESADMAPDVEDDEDVDESRRLESELQSILKS
ncbi:hypothetical protein KEM52_002831 [Ascosphaera acerosa]|nr:hypothetical protein KEM52_002831 [Ascosphaera acerosa]